jgi:hypothetical protein
MRDTPNKRQLIMVASKIEVGCVCCRLQSPVFKVKTRWQAGNLYLAVAIAPHSEPSLIRARVQAESEIQFLERFQAGLLKQSGNS